jgi:alkanesulfonate monooxygenase SsuD/methylene tetrahydromethanopterin reductase-like flavin-dependent oxidoreductase (luciferase family)
MTPFFNPGTNPYGPPRVFIAAVGPAMAEVAGEVADGILVHAFATPEYIKQTMLPAVERGLRNAGRDRSSFEISCPVFVVTGDSDEEVREMEDGARSQIAFYGSTPQYRRVLGRSARGPQPAHPRGAVERPRQPRRRRSPRRIRRPSGAR